jgi:hypothetical protein
MAKLKIFEGNSPGPKVPPSSEGYRQVADRLLANFDTFTSSDTSDKKRTELLVAYAYPHVVYQWSRDPNVEQPIDPENCRIHVKFDERRHGPHSGRHTMVFPGTGDAPVSSGYLIKYVEKIVELYGDGTDPDNHLEACKFLFGIMLLTRCR